MTANLNCRSRWAHHVIVLALACCGAVVKAHAAADAGPIDIRLLPEMERMAEPDQWPAASAQDGANDRQRVLVAWREVSGLVQQKVTAAEVIKLSKWAKVQMRGYTAVPALGRADLRPYTISVAENKIAFEAAVEVLPTHSPLVTRWLKLFVVYDRGRRAISQVVVTIRGEVLE